MNIKYIFVAILACVSASNLAVAQDLDPTVVVNSKYEGKLVKMNKPSFEMAMPDSLTRFDLDFDYLVFHQPYKVSGAFSPHILTMKPAAVASESSKLYLNAGAGYTLHPTLDLVWSPIRGRKFRLDVYADHRSYVGGYRSFDLQGSKDYWSGYDLKSRAGVEGRMELSSLSAGFDVSYYGLASKDLNKNRMYDALDVRLGVSSKPKNASYFKYDVLAAYRFAEDKLQYYRYGREYLSEHLVNLDATLGQVFGGGHQILMDVGCDVAVYAPVAVGQLSFVPRYLLTKERWGVDAGVRVSAIIRSENSEGMFSTRGQIVYPDVKAYYSVISDAMRLYVNVGGGNKLNTYASLLDRNHHTDIYYGIGNMGLMNVTVERVSAALGLEGRVGTLFSYNLHGGYVNYASDLLDAVILTTDPVSGKDLYLPGVGYSAYQKCFAAADWRLISEDFRFDGDVQYTYAWGLNNPAGLFAPAAITGDVSFEYNWNKRIFAGVDCNFSTGRHGREWVKIPGGPATEDAVIPGYVDLGVNFEYAVNRSFSVWARGGNLLDMTIQRNPLFAEKGINFTVGICLNL